MSSERRTPVMVRRTDVAGHRMHIPVGRVEHGLVTLMCGQKVHTLNVVFNSQLAPKEKQWLLDGTAKRVMGWGLCPRCRKVWRNSE